MWCPATWISPASSPAASRGTGKTYPEGGWDAYLERYYYNSVTPLPNSLFSSNEIPPNGPNYYYISDPVIDRTLADYAGAIDPKARMDAIHAFEKRWYDIEPMTILFYPEDAIAVNPKLSGFDSTTFNPVFYPRPENWTIEGRTGNVTAAFASWQPPDGLIPDVHPGLQRIRTCSARSTTGCWNMIHWEKKQLVPALAESVESSADGKHWVIKLRPNVTWHSGEPFTAADVTFTWDTMMNKAYASPFQAQR